ncbi:ZIP family metal transporter [Microvirga soli]|uniref:ZIP family metal transporter n=1 Tax=Microvirga soli TaxID=1854496 RepID=UPI00191F048F|nr:ZIP family zinc transporter [Microvirga soli]
MPLSIQAGLWGLLSGSALVLGALIGTFGKLPQRVIAGVMAFGSGVLISALSFDLMDEAYRQGGIVSTSLGFLAGAVVYTGANILVSRWGARHRKRSGFSEDARPSNEPGSGLAIALGALLDGIPESIVIGVSLLEGAGVSLVAVVAVFLSNLPEGLSSAAGMRRAGHSKAYIFGIWGGIAVISGVAALIGNSAFAETGPATIAFVTAVAAGAILAMLADTMVPEAFETAHEYAGLITVAGFLAAFTLSRVVGA